MHNGAPQPGVMDSLRKVGTGIIRLYKARLELSLLELREEIDRIERRLVLLEVMGFFITMGCICATGVGVVLLARTVGWAWAFGIFTLIYFAGAGIGFLVLQQAKKNRSEPFAHTLREFEKDAEQVCRILEQGDERKERSEQEAAATSRIAPLL